MKKLFLIIALLLISFAATSCNEEGKTSNEETAGVTEEVKGINITSVDNVRTVVAGETLLLTAVVYPKNASQKVLWSSENEEIATVDDKGLVTAVAAGNVNIIATSKENSKVSQSFALIIEEAPEVVINPTSVTVSSVNDSTTCKAGETISLTAIVLPREANQSVNWSTSDDSIATVKRGEVTALKEGQVTITASAKDFDEVYGTIVLTITPADKPVISAEWSTMPFTTFDEYSNCEDDTKVKVIGVVTHVSPLDKNGNVSYFIQNGTSGYYVYAQAISQTSVKVGDVYEVGGYKKYYKGLNEIVNVEHFVESSEQVSFEYLNIGDKNPSSLDDMKPYQAAYVTATATFVSGTVNTKAFNIIVKVNGYDTTLRIDPSYAGEQFDAICDIVAKGVAGSEVEFKGLMTAFGYGTPANQIQIVKASDLVIAEASTEAILAACKEKLTIANAVGFASEKIEIPSAVEGFADVAISWSSDNTAIDVATGKVTHSSEDVTVTLTATLSLAGVSIEKEFKVVVQAADNNTYEVLATLDLEDALEANKYGCSETKPGYAEANVSLGTPKHTWLMRNALIANSSSDKFEGNMGIRAKAGADAAGTARIEILEAGEYNVVEFAGATYGSHVLGSKIRIEYTTDNGATWLTSDVIVTLNSYELETFRVKLPEGVKRVAIVVVENSGKTINLDNIKLMK